MDKKRQIGLLLDAVGDYQGGLMPLGILIDRVEDILDTFQDRSIKDDFFGARLALEEVHARVQSEDFDFQKYGKPVIDLALKEIQIKADLM